MTTTTDIELNQVIDDLALWAIDDNAELMLELAKDYYRSLSEADARDIHSRVY